MEEDDDLWVKMRHKHIADVIEYVNKQQTQLVGFFEGGKVFELFSRNTGSSECGCIQLSNQCQEEIVLQNYNMYPGMQLY